MSQSEFLECIKTSQTLLVTGPTGCGKSTNVPIWLMKEFPDTKVLLIQPRRLPTQRIAQRICDVTGMQLTKEVGFVMGRRYYESPTNKLVVATTGSAVNLVMAKPDYYDFIIIDEIHEMSEQIQQMIALAKELQKSYHFRIILMSATVESEKILPQFPNAQHFQMNRQEGAEKLAVDEQEMKGFLTENVKQIDRENFIAFKNDPKAKSSQSIVGDIIHNQAIQIVRILAGDVKPQYEGDILAFVPGINNFQQLSFDVEELVHKHNIETLYQIKFIHSRFSEELKQSINQQNGIMHIIISTTICETSLTLPNLRYVVDSCLSKSMVNGELLTLAASVEAIIQREGRVGRCAPGVYIPCIQQELLELLPESYIKDDPLKDVDSFILRCYCNQKTCQATVPSAIMSQEGDKAIKIVERVQENLIQQGLLVKEVVGEEKQQMISPTIQGLQISANQESVSSGQEMLFLNLFNIPAVSCLMHAVGKQSDLNIFIHETEIVLRQRELEIVNAIMFTAIVQFFAFVHDGESQNFNQFSSKLKNANGYTFEYQSLFTIIAQDSMTLPNAKSYSDEYAQAKIVALWRQRFPVPTEEPTEEEKLWCDQRLLSPQALREVEIEAISTAKKQANIGLMKEVDYVDDGLTQMRWPCTAQQIEIVMKEMNYDFERNFERHDAVWTHITEQFCKGHKSVIAQFLEVEKRFTRDTLCQLITFGQACANNYSTFIHSKKNKSQKLINNKIFLDSNPKNIRPSNVGAGLEIGRFKQSGKCPTSTDIQSEIASMMQNLKIKNVKCAPKINGKFLDLIRFFAHDKSICHEMQLFLAIGLSGLNLKIKDFTIHDFYKCFNLKDASFYFKKYQNVIFNSLTRECTGEGIIENLNIVDANADNSQKEESNDIDIQINDLPPTYCYQEGFNELKQVDKRYLGQQFLFKLEIARSSANFFFFDDFSLFTCTYFNGRPQLVSIARCGLPLYIVSCIMIGQNKILFEIKDKRMTKVAIKSDKFLFGLQFKQGDQKILDFFHSLQVLSKMFLDQAKQINKKIRQVQVQSLLHLDKFVQLNDTAELFDCLTTLQLEKDQNGFLYAVREIMKFFEKNIAIDDRMALACCGCYEFNPNMVQWEEFTFSDILIVDDGLDLGQRTVVQVRPIVQQEELKTVQKVNQKDADVKEVAQTMQKVDDHQEQQNKQDDAPPGLDEQVGKSKQEANPISIQVEEPFVIEIEEVVIVVLEVSLEGFQKKSYQQLFKNTQAIVGDRGECALVENVIRIKCEQKYVEYIVNNVRRVKVNGRELLAKVVDGKK